MGNTAIGSLRLRCGAHCHRELAGGGGEGEEGREGGEVADMKSNNPHQTGGDKEAKTKGRIDRHKLLRHFLAHNYLRPLATHQGKVVAWKTGVEFRSHSLLALCAYAAHFLHFA